jgi:hypothetical protein
MEEMGCKVQQIVLGKENSKNEIARIVEALEPPSPPAMAGRPSWSMR